MTREAITSLLGGALAAAPDEVVFWSGAGISADAPTCGPVGNALADRALTQAFVPGIGATISSYYAKLGLQRDRPRLETLLDVVHRVHGERVLDDLLSDLAHAQPNALHGFFAEHLERGGRHITANFDTCIERASPHASASPLHFHGSFGGAPLGATLARIERGFTSELRDELEAALTAPATRLIVFVGYSGLDFFDVDPFLRALRPGALSHSQVLWVNHATGGPALVAANRRQLEWLAKAGAATVEIAAPTRDVVEAIAEGWGVALSDPPEMRLPWQPTVAVLDAEKEAATLELYALMNLHKEVRAKIQTPSSVKDWELLAHALWAQGRYGAAGQAWERARGRASDASRAERRAAIFWVRGQFRRARRELIRALANPTTSLEERLVVAELLARVLVHMRRFPDSFLVPTRRLRKFALAELPDPHALAAAGRPLGTHLRVRVASARAALGASPIANEEAVDSFTEYEALGAQLNYRHAALRRRLERENVDPEDLYALRGGFVAIGAHGDAARATLLGGVAIFGWRAVMRAARALDVTHWHRIRLIGASLAASARRRVRVAIARGKHRKSCRCRH